MTDLTAITTPFGLLDRETQEALKAHGGPYECFAVADGVGWKEGALWDNDMENFSALAWRVKPAPPKPREWWLSPDTRAVVLADDPDVTFSPPWVLVREVLPS